MADHNTLIHAFVSGVADLPGSLVKPSDWNHEHKFQGGIDGDLLTKDSSQTDGVLFKSVLTAIRGRLVTFVSLTDTVNGDGSPTRDMTVLNFSLVQSNSTVLIVPQAFTTDNSSAYHTNSENIYIDNVLTANFPVAANGILTCVILPRTNLTSGSHIVKGNFTSSNTPINATLSIYVFEFTA